VAKENTADVFSAFTCVGLSTLTLVCKCWSC